MTHAGHRAYKKVDQRNRPCDLEIIRKNYEIYTSKESID